MLWRSFHRRLGDRYRVVAIDQVSMGFSERTGLRRYAQRVDDLGRILDALDVNDALGAYNKVQSTSVTQEELTNKDHDYFQWLFLL